jgi:isopenicillin N synthase-like dioxygenase
MIPVIDIAPLGDGSHAGLAHVAGEMLAAAEASGFFYIRNHGIDQALIDSVFAVAARFYAAPEVDKRSVTVNAGHRGFLKAGQATMQGATRPDLKESFIWGLDNSSDAHGIPPNRWPDFLPEMRPLLTRYFTEANEVGWRMLRAFAVAIGEPQDRFVRSIAHPTTRGTLIYYPPQPPDLDDEQFGVSPHTDWGCLTLLYQDRTGGLEVRGRDGAWVAATPIPGTFVVNVGDLLARWTNNRFKSTPHRVVNRSGRERYSCAVFVDPDRDTVIDPVVRPGETALFEPVTCGAYVQSRFDAAFAYRQKAPA